MFYHQKVAGVRVFADIQTSHCVCTVCTVVPVSFWTEQESAYPPLPLRKNQESQESDGQTMSWCLDKAPLAQGGGGA